MQRSGRNCCSSMSFMEYQVLGYESPLYGRRTAQFKIQALTYRECAVFHPSLKPDDQALLYGITGGIPHYINKLDVGDDLAGGASHANEISTKVGPESGVCAKYLRVLLDLGILKKETSITEKPGRKTIYTIDDKKVLSRLYGAGF